MAFYLIGDLQGCCQPFSQLLGEIGFSPSRDHLVLLGDLVNRGPESLKTLETVISLEGSVSCLIGNHDMHLISIAYGARKTKHFDTLDEILASPRKQFYVDWLRQQHMALYQHGWLMVHAGVAAQWDVAQTLAYAKEVETVLRAPDIGNFIHEFFGDQPNTWSGELQGFERLRFICSALTRSRFCYADGSLNFSEKGAPMNAPDNLIPWFDVQGRKTANIPIAFGHWATLGILNERPNLLALDTGCLWGGYLTAAKIAGDNKDKNNAQNTTSESVELIQIKCPESLDPFAVK